MIFEYFRKESGVFKVCEFSIKCCVTPPMLDSQENDFNTISTTPKYRNLKSSRQNPEWLEQKQCHLWALGACGSPEYKDMDNKCSPGWLGSTSVKAFCVNIYRNS